MIKPDSKPSLYPYIYIDTTEKKLFLFHPFTDKKIVFLKPHDQKILSFIDGNTKISQIFQRVRKDFPNLMLSDFQRLFKKLQLLNIVYFDAPKSKGFSRHWHSLRVWFHITNQCNLRCASCYVAKTPQKMTVETGYEALEELFISAKKHRYKALNIRFAGGEPLLELEKLIMFGKKSSELRVKYGIEPLLSIITNGVLLTETAAQRLKETGIGVVVSLDGLDKFNDQNRHFADGTGSFEQAIQGIKTARKFGIFRCVAITVTSANVKHLPRFISYLAKNKIAFFTSFYRTPFAGPDRLIPANKDLISTLKKSYVILKKHPPVLGFFSTTLDTVISPCGVGHNQIIIDWTGEIKECQMLTRKIGRIPGKDYLTSMRTASFTHKYHKLLSQTKCGSCRWRYICTSGCSVMHYANLKDNGKLSTPQYCEVYKALIPIMLRSEARLIDKKLLRNHTVNI